MERYRLTLLREPAAVPYGGKITSPMDAVAFAQAALGNEPQEVLLVFHLNTQHRIVGYHEVARGGVAHANVDLRLVFSAALLSGAAKILIVHNHPSGEATPSSQDRALGRRLVRSAELLDFELVDFLVVTADDVASCIHGTS